MNISFSNANKISDLKTKVLVKVVSEDFVSNNRGNGADIDSDPLQYAIQNNGFSGKMCEFTTVTLPSVRVIFCGTGNKDESNKYENIGHKIYKYLRQQEIKDVSILFNANVGDTIIYEEQNNLINIINGFLLSSYDFVKYISIEKQTKNKRGVILNNVVFLTNDKEIEKQFKEIEIVAKNVFFCRDLINEPANVLYPESFVKIIKEMEKIGVEIEIFDKNQLEKMGANALLSVNQGSDNSPYMVVMKYNGGKSGEKPLAFVGKGVCFDSGGLSLKPSTGGSMEMKCDMSGAGVVVSLIKLLAERKAKVNAVGCVALVENMPSGSATKVQDIVKALSGQTIEILNTDAEGRMILADALYYTSTTFNPSVMIDLATLTGAICIALGDRFAGLFSNNNDLIDELKNAGIDTGEQVWSMPLTDNYDKLIDSDWADMKNVGGKDAGSITAAMFLRRHIAGHTKWAHIDIAATAFVSKEIYFVNKGGTGWGVRLLNEFIKKNYEK